MYRPLDWVPWACLVLFSLLIYIFQHLHVKPPLAYDLFHSIRSMKARGLVSCRLAAPRQRIPPSPPLFL
ncbi:hypothetical protein LX32DRAFT_201987 [Colletotrichum zoysiae]|uniref:Uncharacterized protein n=1 Tax=Colletotrichum zoysiae TaxID=1216348 RepID=A0AAD9LVP5_9PEZI|nr:hypothetical protein LX32DRAFT_201987 [Colletotrichum zoysiae]